MSKAPKTDTPTPDNQDEAEAASAPATTTLPLDDEAKTLESGQVSAGGESDNSDTDSGTAHESEGAEGAQDAVAGDVEAPYGRRADGSPASKRGRKPASATDERAKQHARLKSVTASTAKRKELPPVAVTPLAVVNYQAMGESVASLWFNGGTLVFGDEWAPDTKEGEHLAVAAAFRDYFKATNMRDLPPGFALCFVLGVYTLKRASKPTIKSKLEHMGVWIRSKLPGRKSR